MVPEEQKEGDALQSRPVSSSLSLHFQSIMAQFLSGGGVECGPTTALKNVSGRLGQDFSLHQVNACWKLSGNLADRQDRLISTPNVAGPSRPASRAVFPDHNADL